jgi:calcineurin-like phosphoesterase family protein
MKVKLYDPFNKWYKRNGVIWLISDTHFGDSDCKLMDPNWPTPEEQVNIINSYVGKNDTVIHLGDVGNPEYIKKIKGYKVLITGNHDKGVSNYLKSYEVIVRDGKSIKLRHGNLEDYDYAVELFHEYSLECESYDIELRDNKLFDEVYNGPLFINERILLSHEPIKLPFGFNIHGHTHNGLKYVSWANVFTDINICADVRNYIPVRLDKVIEEFKVTTIHRATIDKAGNK